MVRIVNSIRFENDVSIFGEVKCIFCIWSLEKLKKKILIKQKIFIRKDISFYKQP